MLIFLYMTLCTISRALIFVKAQLPFNSLCPCLYSDPHQIWMCSSSAHSSSCCQVSLNSVQQFLCYTANKPTNRQLMLTELIILLTVTCLTLAWVFIEDVFHKIYKLKPLFLCVCASGPGGFLVPAVQQPPGGQDVSATRHRHWGWDHPHVSPPSVSLRPGSSDTVWILIDCKMIKVFID